MSSDEATIQALRLVKETIRLHGAPNVVPVTWSPCMISAVHHAHLKGVTYLENKKETAAVEVACKKEAKFWLIYEKFSREEVTLCNNSFPLPCQMLRRSGQGFAPLRQKLKNWLRSIHNIGFHASN